MEAAKPQKEHLWLKQLAGEWVYDFEAQTPEGTMTGKGTESVRLIGGLWAVAEAQGSMPDGTPATMVLTIGYDAEAGTYVSTWFGSMMTRLWVYDCSMDASGKVLTLASQGPAMDGSGGTDDYQDVVEVIDNNRRLFSSRVKARDGGWNTFMKMTYTRTA